MVSTKVYVCITCKVAGEDTEERAGARLFRVLNEQNTLSDAPIELVPVECLSVCKRPCTVSFAAPGKWTYVVGGLDPDQNVGDILQFAQLHRASADGLTVWRERPVHIRKNTIARVPPMPISKEIS